MKLAFWKKESPKPLPELREWRVIGKKARKLRSLYDNVYKKTVDTRHTARFDMWAYIEKILPFDGGVRLSLHIDDDVNVSQTTVILRERSGDTPCTYKTTLVK